VDGGVDGRGRDAVSWSLSHWVVLLVVGSWRAFDRLVYRCFGGYHSHYPAIAPTIRELVVENMYCNSFSELWAGFAATPAQEQVERSPNAASLITQFSHTLRPEMSPLFRVFVCTQYTLNNLIV
jgi:hypothetical protein